MNFRKNLLFSDVMVFLLAVGLFISPFVVDRSNLPFGWELPKVWFWQLYGLFLLALIFLHFVFNFISKSFDRKLDFSIKKLIKSNVSWVLLILVLILLSISTFHTTNFYVGLFQQYNSPLYEFLGNFLNLEDSVVYKLSFLGNQFRQTGLITLGILIILFWLIRNYFDKKNIHFIFFGLVLSSSIQAIVGIFQFVQISDSTKLVEEGKWVFGTFGQSNFYVGLLLIGIIFSLFYLRFDIGSKIEFFGLTYNFTDKSKKFFKLLIFVLLQIQIVAVILTTSIWGLFVLLIALCLVISFELLQKYFLRVFLTTVIFLLISFLPLMRLASEINEDYRFRILIWEEIWSYYIEGSNLNSLDSQLQSGINRIFFGSGADTLGEILKQSIQFRTIYLDRAHNIFLQILSSFGFITLGFFVFFITYPFVWLKKNVKNRVFVYSLITLFILIYRGMIHTDSIVNIVYIFLMISLLFSFQKQKAA